MEDEISADGVTMSHRLFNLLPGVTCLSPCCELVPTRTRNPSARNVRHHCEKTNTFGLHSLTLSDQALSLPDDFVNSPCPNYLSHNDCSQQANLYLVFSQLCCYGPVGEAFANPTLIPLRTNLEPPRTNFAPPRTNFQSPRNNFEPTLSQTRQMAYFMKHGYRSKAVGRMYSEAQHNTPCPTIPSQYRFTIPSHNSQHFAKYL